MREEEKDIDVEIADLRGQINVFEIMGPKSSQVLRGALNPVLQDQRKDFTQVANSSSSYDYIDMSAILVLESLDGLADSWFDTSWHDNRIQSDRPATHVGPFSPTHHTVSYLCLDSLRRTQNPDHQAQITCQLR